VAADGCGRGLPGRIRRADPRPGSSEVAARLVPFAELDHLGLFAVDIVVRLVLVDQRARYLVRHWYDVLVLALPLLRPLRLLR
jgi:hypothetical protein